MLKPILTFSLIITMCFLGISQSNQDELQLMQSLYGMEKRDIIAEFVELSEAQENEFWVLYDEYENKRKALGQERFDLLQRYVNDYGEVRPENAENFMKQAIPIRIKTDKLRDTYYQKIKSRTDPVVAMQFYQIENYLYANATQ